MQKSSDNASQQSNSMLKGSFATIKWDLSPGARMVQCVHVKLQHSTG